jgi:hypothetical protein
MRFTSGPKNWKKKCIGTIRYMGNDLTRKLWLKVSGKWVTIYFALLDVDPLSVVDDFVYPWKVRTDVITKQVRVSRPHVDGDLAPDVYRTFLTLRFPEGWVVELKKDVRVLDLVEGLYEELLAKQVVEKL